MRRPWNLLLILVAVLGFALGAFALSLHHTLYYTCEKCGSIMQVRERVVLPGGSTTWERQRPGFAGCEHVLRPGASLGQYDRTIADGQLVLVRRPGACGGFIIDRRLTGPDQIGYTWWYRADGDGNLGHSGVHTGTGACRFPQPIGFGPFELIWSSAVNGITVGYGHGPGKNTLDRELAICATDLPGVDGVDAASPQWLYRRCSE